MGKKTKKESANTKRPRRPSDKSAETLRGRAKLLRISLESGSANHSVVDRSNLPKQFLMEITTESSLHLADAESKKDKVQVTLSFSIGVYYSKDDDQPAMKFDCVYKLVYEIKGGKKPTETQLASFAGIDSIRTAWPYVGEYAQSMAHRMGYPAINLPVYDSSILTPTPN